MSQLKPVQPVIEKLFYIINKRGEVVPFILNNIQKQFHDNRTLWNDILKFRQGGITSFVQAWFLVECLHKPTRAVMIAHDRDHTEKLLQRVHFFLNTMKGPKAKVGHANEQELTFPKTHSSFYIGTAGSKQYGRSDTITHLHCSEYAFWRDPESLMAGLFQAVPHDTGVIVKECTANGYGTFHHQQYMKAVKGTSKFKAFFFPWHIFEEYQSKTPLSGELTEEERKLKEKFGLTDAQLQWRREKIEEFNGDVSLFRQEYPLTIEEAFRVTGGSLFPNATHMPSKMWCKAPSPVAIGTLHVHSEHPKKGLHYVFGVDVSGGTGHDYSVIQGLCVETLEQVLSFRVNTLSPPVFAEAIVALAKQFYIPYLVIEANQHGLSLIPIVCGEEPYVSNLHQVYKMKPRTRKYTSSVQKASDYGFKTTSTSKYTLIGNLQHILPELTLYDEVTCDQLRGFGETDLGTLGNIASGGGDDEVMALALACEGVLKQRLYLGGEPEPTKPQGFVCTLEDMMERIKPRQKGWFSKQTSETSLHF